MSMQGKCSKQDMFHKMLVGSVFPVKKVPPTRKCEVIFAYSPLNPDELQLNVGEVIEIVREVQSPLLALKPEVCFAVSTRTPVHCLLNRLKMGGGWGSKTAKWEHFLQILSLRYSLHPKVGEDDIHHGSYLHTDVDDSSVSQRTKTTRRKTDPNSLMCSAGR